MSGKLIAIVVAVLVIVGGGVAALTMSHKDKKTPTTTSQSSKKAANDGMTEEEMTNSNNDESSSNTNQVEIKDFAFSPANITVKKGTTVTWMNSDSVAHTVTENDDQDGPDSGSLAPGKSFSFTYNSVGSFKYFCSFHPNMTGTVTVTE